MNYLASFFTTPVDHTRYLDFPDLDALRPVSTDTKDAVEKDHLWGSFARSVGCDFLHNRTDVKWYFADLKKVAKRANDLFFPMNQSEFISETEKIRNKKKYSSIDKAPTRDEVRELQTVRENVDIQKIWHHLFGRTNVENITNRYLRGNFKNKIKKIASPPVLDLSGKQLTYLPPVFSKNSTLQHLNLFNNEFSKIPEGIEEFQNLQSLDLSGNEIESVPREVGKLTNLQSLDLSNNKISHLPYEVESMPNCEILTDGNPLAKKRSGEELKTSPKRQKPDVE